MVPAPKTPVEAFMPSSLASSQKPTTPPHILVGGSVDTAAPTTPVEIVERLEDSFPPMQWNRPTYKGKGGDAVLYYGGMRTTTEEGPVIRSTCSYAWSEFATASGSNDSSTGYTARTCYPTSTGYATARGFGESAATSISGS